MKNKRVQGKIEKRERRNVMPDINDKKAVDTSISIDEKTKNNEVDKGSTETTKVEETQKVDETAKETSQTPSGDEQDKGGNETADTNTDKGEEPTEDTAQQEQVQETEPTGNGIRIEDLVTKEELADRLSAMEAKFDAVLKENGDLKNKLSAMEEKYENKDFGNLQKQGMLEKDKQANSTFEEYARQFS